MIAYKNTKNMGYLFHQKKKEGFCTKKKLFKTGLILMSGITIGTALLPSTMVLATDVTTGIELQPGEQIITKEEASSMNDGLLYSQEIDTNSMNSISPRLVITDGQWKWKKIGTDYRNTKQDEKLKANIGNLVYNIAFAYFGGKLIKNALKVGEITGAVSSGFLASIKKPIKKGKTVYYTVTTYEDKDSRNYYVKENVKAYSDSARKKLVGSYDSVHKFTKK